MRASDLTPILAEGVRAVRAGLPRVLVGVAIACAAVAAVAALPLGPALRATLWSALMLASFVGWGTLVNCWLAPADRKDWGLRAGWGLALFVLTGGFLCLAHLAVRATFIAQVALGVVALLVATLLRPSRVSEPSQASLGQEIDGGIGPRALFATILVAYTLATLTFFAFLGNHKFQPSDDPPFYFMLAQKLVQVGSVFEPFAGRRVTVLGGQVYLHASFVSVASIYYLHVVDAGISLLIVVGLLVGDARRRVDSKTHALVLAAATLLLFTLRDVRVNTTSHGSGLAALLTLYRTVRTPLGAGQEAPRSLMEPRRVVALSALALTSMLLRVSNGPTALLFVAFVLGSDFVLAARRRWNRGSLAALLRAGALCFSVLVAALLPWCILEHESTGTFFYPLGHNNLTPGWTLGLEAARSWRQEWTELWANLSYGRPVSDFILFVVAGIVPAAGGRRNDAAAFSLASFIGFITFSHSGVAFGPWHVARYVYAFVAAAALVVVLSVDQLDLRAALVAGAIAIQLAYVGPEVRRTLQRNVREARRTFEDDHNFAALTLDYEDVQSHIPPQATMATAVFEGFRFDFKRNRIFALDVLGGMGPKPGWPAKRGPQALGEYLVASGIQYLVWTDFNLPSEFYNREHWISHLNGIGLYLHPQAVLQLDAEDSIEKLSAMRRIVYQGHGMTVMDLMTAR
jgi:hypothetical protein